MGNFYKNIGYREDIAIHRLVDEIMDEVTPRIENLCRSEKNIFFRHSIDFFIDDTKYDNVSFTFTFEEPLHKTLSINTYLVAIDKELRNQLFIGLKRLNLWKINFDNYLTIYNVFKSEKDFSQRLIRTIVTKEYINELMN